MNESIYIHSVIQTALIIAYIIYAVLRDRDIPKGRP